MAISVLRTHIRERKNSRLYRFASKGCHAKNRILSHGTHKYISHGQYIYLYNADEAIAEASKLIGVSFGVHNGGVPSGVREVKQNKTKIPHDLI